MNGALNVFPDNNDWRGSSAALLDNPRFETLWSYMFSQFEIIETVRTGKVVMARGEQAT